MSLPEHVESLRSKHQHLEQCIEAEMHRPMPDQMALSRLKKEKLHIKEQIERLAIGETHISSNGSGAFN